MSEEPVSRGFRRKYGYHLLNAICPDDGQPWTLGVLMAHAAAIARQGEHRKKEMMHTLQWALQHPTSIHCGLKRDTDHPKDDSEGWWCYVSRPGVRYTEHCPNGIAPENRVFLVFVTREHVVYNWRWEKSGLFADLPADINGRFDRQVS